MKNNLESIKSDLSEKVKKYNGRSIDWSKDMIVETWDEKLEREEREEREREEREEREREEREEREKRERKEREEREERERKEREVLEDFRKQWEEKIDLNPTTKNAIINAVNQIPHRAKIEKD